jgi:DNA-binding transcriptional LysR family regulator
MMNHAQLTRIDTNLLLLFDLLFEQRNAGRAAAKLHLSPSAVSHSLRRLRTMLNDPLFLPSRKGLVPTQRAEALAPAVRDIIERISGVIASAVRFDPATALRRFRVGAPDGAVSVLVPALVGRLAEEAPGIDLSVLQLLPRPGGPEPGQAWREALTDVDAGRIDAAILPYQPPQARFRAIPLYAEDFVVVTARGHPLAKNCSIDTFSAARHVLVSASGDTSGFVDRLLAERGFERRVALTVPSFFMAASAIAASDLIGALPRRFARQVAANFPIELVEPPFPMLSTALHAIVPQASMLDEGLVWLLERIRASFT